MTILHDGRTMLVTVKEIGAIALGNGSSDLADTPDDEEFEWWMEAHFMGVAWLAMTDETVFRWCNGSELADAYEPGHVEKYAEIFKREAAQREAWYA